MKKSKATDDYEIPAEIDFSNGVRGKYAVHFPKGSRLVLLDSDVAEVFPTQEAANKALRGLAEIINNNNPVKRRKTSAKSSASRH